MKARGTRSSIAVLLRSSRHLSLRRRQWMLQHLLPWRRIHLLLLLLRRRSLHSSRVRKRHHRHRSRLHGNPSASKPACRAAEMENCAAAARPNRQSSSEGRSRVAKQQMSNRQISRRQQNGAQSAVPVGCSVAGWLWWCARSLARSRSLSRTSPSVQFPRPVVARCPFPPGSVFLSPFGPSTAAILPSTRPRFAPSLLRASFYFPRLLLSNQAIHSIALFYLVLGD